MPVTGYYGVSVTTGYRTTRRRVLVSANEMPENRTAFNFTSYHHTALRFVRRTYLLAPPLTLDPTLPSCDITSCVPFQYRHTIFVLYLSMPLYFSLCLLFSFTASFVFWVCLEGQARDLPIRDADGLVEYMRSYERIGAFGGVRLELWYY